jgi:hypothetical protein
MGLLLSCYRRTTIKYYGIFGVKNKKGTSGEKLIKAGRSHDSLPTAPFRRFRRGNFLDQFDEGHAELAVRDRRERLRKTKQLRLRWSPRHAPDAHVAADRNVELACKNLECVRVLYYLLN